MDCSTPGSSVFHYLLDFAQTHVHWVGDAIQPSHPLSPPSPPAFSLSQHQGLFQWVSSLHQMTKGLELHLQHQFFQWLFIYSYYKILAVFPLSYRISWSFIFYIILYFLIPIPALSFFLPICPLVTTSLFSISVSLFLFCDSHLFLSFSQIIFFRV